MEKSCYTCCPHVSARIVSHIIKDGTLGRLHFDLKNRRYFIYTPFLHVEHLTDLPGEDLKAILLESMDMVRHYSGCNDCSVTYNMGQWKTHFHCHIKIKIDEATFCRLKRLHLQGFRAPFRMPPSEEVAV